MVSVMEWMLLTELTTFSLVVIVKVKAMKINPWLKKEPYHEFWTGLQCSYLKIYSWIICFDLFVLFCSAFCVFAFWEFVICWFLSCVVMLLWIVGLAMPTPWAAWTTLRLSWCAMLNWGCTPPCALRNTAVDVDPSLWFAAWPKAHRMLLGFVLWIFHVDMLLEFCFFCYVVVTCCSLTCMFCDVVMKCW